MYDSPTLQKKKVRKLQNESICLIKRKESKKVTEFLLTFLFGQFGRGASRISARRSRKETLRFSSYAS
jgi:hypothetical protein